MTLAEMMGTGFAVRKTVWSKRGDRITRRMVDQDADLDIEPRTRIAVEDKADAREPE